MPSDKSQPGQNLEQAANVARSSCLGSIPKSLNTTPSEFGRTKLRFLAKENDAIYAYNRCDRVNRLFGAGACARPQPNFATRWRPACHRFRQQSFLSGDAYPKFVLGRVDQVPPSFAHSFLAPRATPACASRLRSRHRANVAEPRSTPSRSL